MPRSRTAVTRVVVATTAAALAAVPLAASAAQAAPAATPPNLNVTYDAVGTSHVAKTDSDVALGPTTLSTSVAPAGGALTGHLPIPQTSTTFKTAGLLPTTATIDFIEAAPVTGTLGRDGTRTVVNSTASYYLKLSNVTVAGVPALVGDSCQTVDPVLVPANTPAGQSFNITSGGELAGTYTIGAFAHCGLATELINIMVPGPGNTVDLTVSHGRLG